MMKNPANIRTAFGMIATLVPCCVFLFLFCGPLPSDIGKNNFPIQLALEDGAATTATFSGQPIVATVTLPDSEYFDDIAWHVGSGAYRHSGITPVKKIKQLQVDLYWTSIPLCKDTVTKQFYDTVYVSTHGETIRSNRVKVIVTNVSPMIDSVKIGASAGRNDDTVRYFISMADTGSYCALRVFTHDPNSGDVLRYDWYSARIGQLLPVPTVQYKVPKTQFTDTVFVTVYDGKGGSASRIIIVTKLPPNSPPVIDSISVGGSVFLQDTTFHVYSSRQLDTVKFRVFAHDADSGDMLTYVWTKKNKKDSLMRSSSATAFQTVLVCDTTYRKANDSLRTADTVTVVVRDLRGDSAKTIVRLVQGHLNISPKIDSIRVNGLVQCKGPSALLARDSAYAWARDTFMLRVFSTDPDSGDTVKLIVRAKQTSVVTKLSDTTAQYVCMDYAYTDTVLCIVKDLSGDSTVKMIVITVINRPPVLDSIRVNGIVQCKGPSALLSRDTTNGGDTLLVRIYASDPDKGDSVKVGISSGQASSLSKLSDTIARYICKDSLYTDTVVCVAKDVIGDSAKKSIVVAINNRYPRIDSLRVIDTLGNGSATFTVADQSQSFGHDSIAARDSVKLRLYAHDPDVTLNDSITLVQWTTSSLKTMKLLDNKGLFVQYPGQNSTYSDTVLVKVFDRKQKWTRRSIIINTR